MTSSAIVHVSLLNASLINADIICFTPIFKTLIWYHQAPPGKYQPCTCCNEGSYKFLWIPGQIFGKCHNWEMPSAKQKPSNIKYGGGIRPNVWVLTCGPACTSKNPGEGGNCNIQYFVMGWKRLFRCSQWLHNNYKILWRITNNSRWKVRITISCEESILQKFHLSWTQTFILEPGAVTTCWHSSHSWHWKITVGTKCAEHL